MLGAFRAFSYGSLYPTLRRLRERGLDRRGRARSGRDGAGADRPPRQGRLPAHRRGQGAARRAARRGRAAAYDDEGFGVHFAFFAQTHAEVRLRILEGRRRRRRGAPGRPARALARTGEQLDRYTLQLQQLGLDAVEREVRWLNELIDTERQEQAAAPPQNQKETP